MVEGDENQVRHLVTGVIVVEVVVALGTRRYELQNEVAGPPSIFKAPKTPVTTRQLTARGASALLEARAAQEAGAIRGIQLTAGGSAAVTETTKSRTILNSNIRCFGVMAKQRYPRCINTMWRRGFQCHICTSLIATQSRPLWRRCSNIKRAIVRKEKTEESVGLSYVEY
jgi:hypothetical protein